MEGWLEVGKNLDENKWLEPRQEQKEWREREVSEKHFKELETDDLLIGYGTGGNTVSPHLSHYKILPLIFHVSGS